MTSCVICSGLVGPYPEVYKRVKICRTCELERMGAPLEEPSAEDFIRGSQWVTAKTMLHIPHQYTVRDLTTEDARKSTCRSHWEFEWFAELTIEEGTRERWGKHNNSYLIVGSWKYWIMDPPEFIGVTSIINREAVSDEAKEYMAGEVARLKGAQTLW